MQATVLRLLEALAEPLEAAVLGPALVREVYFRVLTGAQGGAMREAPALRGRFGSIGRVLRTIHAGYATLDGATGHRSGHECGDLPRPLPRDYRHVADAVREVDPPAPGTVADAAAG
jgi:hypothetical protein